MNKVVKYHDEENMLIQISFLTIGFKIRANLKHLTTSGEINRLLAFFTIRSLSNS